MPLHYKVEVGDGADLEELFKSRGDGHQFTCEGFAALYGMLEELGWDDVSDVVAIRSAFSEHDADEMFDYAADAYALDGLCDELGIDAGDMSDAERIDAVVAEIGAVETARRCAEACGSFARATGAGTVVVMK